MNMLIDRYRNEFVFECIEDGLILENRRTVGNPVVSDAAQRMSAAHEHVDRLLLLLSMRPRLQHREFPGQRAPRLFGRRSQPGMQFLKLRFVNTL